MESMPIRPAFWNIPFWGRDWCICRWAYCGDRLHHRRLPMCTPLARWASPEPSRA